MQLIWPLFSLYDNNNGYSYMLFLHGAQYDIPIHAHVCSDQNKKIKFCILMEASMSSNKT